MAISAMPSHVQMRDAVAVSLNHRDGLSTMSCLPYEFDGATLAGDATFRQAGRSDIFQWPESLL